MKKRCKYCNHEWEARVRKPKACPACKRYFPLADFQELIHNKQEENETIY